MSPQTAPNDAILLFDGVFLCCPELFDYWDVVIFVEVDFEVALARACERDQEMLGSPEAIRRRYHQRYFPGQRLYFDLVQPQSKADVIVRNNDLDNPEIIWLT